MNGKPLYKLSSNEVDLMSNELKKFTSFVPSDFNRKTRGLEEISRWKATELRQFLLYTGPLALLKALRNIEDNRCVNFLTLHVAVRIFADRQYAQIYSDYASKLLIHFVENVILIYGGEYVSHNVHGLIHVANDVENFGTLDSYSSFQFENFLQEIKKLIRKPNLPLQQIIRRYKEKIDCESSSHDAMLTSKLQMSSIHSNGPLLENCGDPQYSVAQNKYFRINLTEKDSCVQMQNDDIIAVKNICFNCQLNSLVFIGQKYKNVSDLYKVPCQSALVGVHKIEGIDETLNIWPTSLIKRKFYKLPLDDSGEKYAAFALVQTS